ncbi:MULTISPECIES: sigma-70 family RNA polymerase sigma factor [unclassified Streptomyces]|uniref:sigma-70 family RNA polymerase sigma factor n=1 Tax=unclassified Streptomyces TaxID=2593676 RepID=UPI002E14BA5C|nr:MULTISPECIES: sigma-70 family RNA polymerase sigma factor [unclassified Streptomyces]WSR23974.1 sigma-70 family RNA polymerase sigma factor [Streptomyces sp. NBC_01205]
MSTSGTAHQQDLHDLSDAQLCALLRERDSASGADVSDVMGEVFARHHDAVRAYARTCCRDLATASDLAAEAFARTYRAVAWGAGPEYAWRPYLLTCVRRVATEWARRGARTQLSADFDTWAAELSGDQDVEGAALSAEEGSLILRAYRSLPERWQSVLWHAVVDPEPAAETARRLGISSGGVNSLAARAREGLREAYLRAHLDQSASDECRHYGGLLAAALRRPGKRVTQDLGRHLQACHGCGRAERDLRAVNNRLGAVLPAGVLLWHPASSALSAGVHGAHHLAAGKAVGLKLAAARFGAGKWTAAAAVAGTTLTAFVLLPAEDRPERAAPAPTVTSPIPGPSEEPNPYLLPYPTESASPPIVSIGAPMSAVVAPSAPVTPKPSSASTASTSPTPTSTGLRFVNTGSGLCVGFAGSGSEGPLELQPCTGDASQGWQRLPAGQGAYQFRNTGTGTCLDGTSAGGNTVDVALRTCRSGAGRTTQLWRSEPVGGSGAFRLWFVPPVSKSDYSDHLLGPRNWPKTDPPRRGSDLVQLPNYYNSVNFLFTLG